MKIEASTPASEEEAEGIPEGSEAKLLESPATLVKLELPVKLLRRDESVQISQCEQDTDDRIIQRSISLPEPGRSGPWTSPWGSSWGPWVADYPLDPLGLESAGVAGIHDQFGLEQPPGFHSQDGEPLTLSLGSTMHAAGQCLPCAWFWKPGSCQNAEKCSYCHLCPEGELKARKKNKVAMMRLGIVTPKAKHERDANGNVLRLSPLL